MGQGGDARPMGRVSVRTTLMLSSLDRNSRSKPPRPDHIAACRHTKGGGGINNCSPWNRAEKSLAGVHPLATGAGQAEALRPDADKQNPLEGSQQVPSPQHTSRVLAPTHPDSGRNGRVHGGGHKAAMGAGQRRHQHRPQLQVPVHAAGRVACIETGKGTVCRSVPFSEWPSSTARRSHSVGDPAVSHGSWAAGRCCPRQPLALAPKAHTSAHMRTMQRPCPNAPLPQPHLQPSVQMRPGIHASCSSSPMSRSPATMGGRSGR